MAPRMAPGRACRRGHRQRGDTRTAQKVRVCASQSEPADAAEVVQIGGSRDLRCLHLVTSRGGFIAAMSVSGRLAGFQAARRNDRGLPGIYRAAPAMYAATIYVACRSKDAR